MEPMTDHTVRMTTRQIGPLGTPVRICVGSGLLIAGLMASPTGLELLTGFVLFPAVELVILAVLRPPGSQPLRIYGLVGYGLNDGLGAVLFLTWTNPMLLFAGASVLLAVAKGYAGCELFALSNLLRRRDDQIACAVFSPIDALEARGG